MIAREAVWLQADPNAGVNLLAAQARFPVVAPEEMAADFASGESSSALRGHLAARIGNYGTGSVRMFKQCLLQQQGRQQQAAATKQTVSYSGWAEGKKKSEGVCVRQLGRTNTHTLGGG